MRRALLCLALLLGLALPLGAQRTAATFVRDGVTSFDTATVNVTYSGSLQLNVFYDSAWAANSRPVIIFVHGGGWTGGARTNAGVQGVAQRFAELGFVAISASYTLADADPGTAVNPQTPITDMLSLMTWARANADTYRGDTTNVAMYGQSAGSHLIAMAATQCTVGTTCPDAIVLASGVYDLEDLTGTSATYALDYMNVAFAGNEAAWRAKSPTRQWGASARMPVRLIHGLSEGDNEAAGAGINIAQAREFRTTLAAISGQVADTAYFAGTKHGTLGDADSFGNSDDVNATAAWLYTQLGVTKTVTSRTAASGRAAASGRTSP